MRGSTGWEIHKSCKIKILMFKIMKSRFYYTNPKREKSIKPLNLVSKYNFTIKWPKIAIILVVTFPMLFL